MVSIARVPASACRRLRWASCNSWPGGSESAPPLDCGRSASQDAGMAVDRFAAWLTENHDGLMLGAGVGVALVVVMLALRSYGRSLVERDPHGLGWRTVIGRVLAKTGIAFMIVTVADVLATYAEVPPRVAHLVDIAFTIAAALQAAVWARELILGLIGRRVAEENGSGAL